MTPGRRRLLAVSLLRSLSYDCLAVDNVFGGLHLCCCHTHFFPEQKKMLVLTDVLAVVLVVLILVIVVVIIFVVILVLVVLVVSKATSRARIRVNAAEKLPLRNVHFGRSPITWTTVQWSR